MNEFPPDLSLSWGDPVDHSNRDQRPEPIINPFTVIVDTREQAGWSFTGFNSDSDRKFRPLVIYTESKGLKTGDYSIKGFEDQVCVERKSPADAFSTFTVDRERFERELERMKSMRFSAVVIECDWERILLGPDKVGSSDEHRRVIGKTVYRSILAWQQRFPNVHWLPMPGRAAAEMACFDVLTRFWKERQEELKAAQRARQAKLFEE